MEAKEKQRKEPSMADMQRYVASVSSENKQLKEKLNEAYSIVDSLQTQNLFSYINFCTKVMDHPEMYEDDFVSQMSNDVEVLMMRLHMVMVEAPNRLKDGAEDNGEEATS